MYVQYDAGKYALQILWFFTPNPLSVAAEGGISEYKYIIPKVFYL